MSGELILLMEDHELNLELARDVLQLHGFRTLEARTAAEGIELARTHRPDLVLLDIQLPDRNGLAVLRQLRQMPETARLPVVALTAFAMREDRERLLAAGFDAYLSKPLDVRALPDQVRQACARAGQER
jgi:two-component system, cell cycle response regulator DivK